MTEQEKQLLFKDLCARLPYGVKGTVKTTDGNGQEITDDGIINSAFIDEHGKAYICVESAEYELEDVKPYLRPLSSMTEGEKEIYQGYQDAFANSSNTYFFDNFMSIDYLNCKHFDYLGLIEKGLAIEAPKGMYDF